MEKQYPYEASKHYLVSSSKQLESFHEVSSNNPADWSLSQYIVSIICISLLGGCLVSLGYSLFLGLKAGLYLGILHGMICGILLSFLCLSKWKKE